MAIIWREPLNRGVECRWGIGRSRDSGLIAGYWRLLDVWNIYRRRSWEYDAVGHAPLTIDRLLDVRTTKWQKQLPTTMQCRSHSRRRTIECLFVISCSMDQYAEKNLIVRVVYLKPKQLIIKDCARRFVFKLYSREASRGLFATAELVFWVSKLRRQTSPTTAGGLVDYSRQWHCHMVVCSRQWQWKS